MSFKATWLWVANLLLGLCHLQKYLKSSAALWPQHMCVSVSDFPSLLPLLMGCRFMAPVEKLVKPTSCSQHSQKCEMSSFPSAPLNVWTSLAIGSLPAGEWGPGHRALEDFRSASPTALSLWAVSPSLKEDLDGVCPGDAFNCRLVEPSSLNLTVGQCFQPYSLSNKSPLWMPFGTDQIHMVSSLCHGVGLLFSMNLVQESLGAAG